MKNMIWIHILALVLIGLSFGCGSKSSSSPASGGQVDIFDVMRMAPPTTGDVTTVKSRTECQISVEYQTEETNGLVKFFRQLRTEKSRETVKTYALDQSASILSETTVISTTWQKKANEDEAQVRYTEYEVYLDEYKKSAAAESNFVNYAVHSKLRRIALPGFFFEDGTNEKSEEKRNFGRMYDDGKTFYYEHDNEGDVLRPAQAVFEYKVEKTDREFRKVMTLQKPYLDPEFKNKKVLKERRNCLTIFE